MPTMVELMKILLLGALILVIVSAGGIWWMSQNFPSNTQPPTDTSETVQQVSLTGSYICLPPNEGLEPHTLECALGINVNNSNYALQTNGQFIETLSSIQPGDLIKVNGGLKYIDQLADQEPLLQYDIVGVIEVDLLEIVTDSDPENQESISVNNLTFRRPKNFGLAVNLDQVLVESVIPPCDEGFDYCLYYNGPEYLNTNFDSAGVRIQRRLDLTSSEACLNELPLGYTNLEPSIHQTSTYTTSLFTPLQNSGTGHTATGSLYRLSFNNVCYEFETRIGRSQVENYEPGTITEITDEQLQSLENQLHSIIENISFTDSQTPIEFPQSLTSLHIRMFSRS